MDQGDLPQQNRRSNYLPTDPQAAFLLTILAVLLTLTQGYYGLTKVALIGAGMMAVRAVLRLQDNRNRVEGRARLGLRCVLALAVVGMVGTAAWVEPRGTEPGGMLAGDGVTTTSTAPPTSAGATPSGSAPSGTQPQVAVLGTALTPEQELASCHDALRDVAAAIEPVREATTGTAPPSPTTTADMTVKERQAECAELIASIDAAIVATGAVAPR